MTTEEIKKLPVEEKLRMMQVLWEDMPERFERSPIRAEHKKLLDQRRARHEANPSSLLEWDAVKDSFGGAASRQKLWLTSIRDTGFTKHKPQA